MYGIILAGGSGSRLWPLSRELYPKQLLNLNSDKSLLQSTFERLKNCMPGNNIISITNTKHASNVRMQLSDMSENPVILSEPTAKNTAPAIVLAVKYIIQKSNTDPVILVVPSDHLIKDNEKFLSTVKKGEKLAQQGYIVTFGIKPHYPETGYGYINTAEPVSSGSITKGYGLDYSSATIRNDMAQLENIGFLDKPHTSAGRVPSAKGYRYYVNELLKEDNLSLEEIKYIKNKLEIKVNEIEDLTKVATTTLSEITHYTTVAVGPKADKQIIEEIKFVSLGQRMLMVVIVTDTGLVKETIIKFDEDVTESQVDTLNALFNNRLKGKPLAKIDRPMAEYIFSEVHYSIGIMQAIIEQINRIVEEENNNIFLEGAKKSFDLPEFKSMKVAKNFVNLIDTKEEMLEIFNSGEAEDINVFIGDDDENSNLKDFSIITFKHTVGNKDLGTIGIIGPKRMDYSKVIAVMKYISKKLKEDNEKKEGM